MLDILKMGITSSVQRSKLTACTVTFPDYCKQDVTKKPKRTDHHKVILTQMLPFLISDLLYNEDEYNGMNYWNEFRKRNMVHYQRSHHVK